MSRSTRKENSAEKPRRTKRQASESAATTLPAETPTGKDRPRNVQVLDNGLRMESLPGGRLSFELEASGSPYTWVVDGRDCSNFAVISGSENMPLPLHCSRLRDIKRLLLSEALVIHTKRIKAYALQRLQLECAIRDCKEFLVDGRIKSAGACNYVLVNLCLEITGERGRLVLELWYEDFSLHLVRSRLTVDGSAAFKAPVTDKVDDIVAMLDSNPLDEVRSTSLVPLGRCVSASKCPKRCLPILDPVCGSDGQRYLNHCRMQEANCGKNVVVMPKGFCS
ncbi:hypothetical protein ISCGN_009303 [Ixodes scapularis]